MKTGYALLSSAALTIAIGVGTLLLATAWIYHTKKPQHVELVYVERDSVSRSYATAIIVSSFPDATIITVKYPNPQDLEAGHLYQLVCPKQVFTRTLFKHPECFYDLTPGDWK